MRNDRPVAWICRAAIVLAIAGVFGTWRVAGAVSLDGFEGPHNGWLVIIFGLIALAGVGALARGSWFGIVTVLGAAAVMISAAVEDLVQDGSVLGGRSGWGIWLTLAASVVLAGTAVRAAVWRIRPPRAAPRDAVEAD
jgi:putative intracellular protease/amidase